MPTTPKRDFDLIDGLFQLSFVLQARLSRVAAAHELSLVQMRLLGILRDREPGMLELARHLDLEKSSLSGLIDRAETRGLVERVPSRADRRATTVRMTARGHKLVRAVEGEIAGDLAALLAPLAAKERDKLAALVRRILPAGELGDDAPETA